MATLFRRMAARLARKAWSGNLQVLACLVAIPLVLTSSAAAAVLYLPELCKLSVEELLLVRVVDPVLRHSPQTSLIDLELEELLIIKAVRHHVQ